MAFHDTVKIIVIFLYS